MSQNHSENDVLEEVLEMFNRFRNMSPEAMIIFVEQINNIVSIQNNHKVK